MPWHSQQDSSDVEVSKSASCLQRPKSLRSQQQVSSTSDKRWLQQRYCMSSCQALGIPADADEVSLAHTCHCALQCAAQGCCAGQPPQQHAPTQAALLVTAWCHAQATQRNPIPPPGPAFTATQQRSWREASESLAYTAGLLLLPVVPSPVGRAGAGPYKGYDFTWEGRHSAANAQV